MKLIPTYGDPPKVFIGLKHLEPLLVLWELQFAPGCPGGRGLGSVSHSWFFSGSSSQGWGEAGQ